LWQGKKLPTGYGRISHEATEHYIHRLSYELHRGSVPDGLYVCHTCDTPSCWNPDHLWLGTHQNNMHDMRVKRRGANQFTKGHARMSKKEQEQEQEQVETAAEKKAKSFSSTAYLAAEQKLKALHKEEFEALIDAEFAAAGIERKRRLTEEERAAKEAREAEEKALKAAAKAEAAREKALEKARELAEKYPDLVSVTS
jgi:hypothetical protein